MVCNETVLYIHEDNSDVIHSFCLYNSYRRHVVHITYTVLQQRNVENIV